MALIERVDRKDQISLTNMVGTLKKYIYYIFKSHPVLVVVASAFLKSIECNFVSFQKQRKVSFKLNGLFLQVAFKKFHSV